ncbi:MAG: AraC family transcriptional regulator [Lachnospiraceae bacterium]|nr:AraC family transcriptional regulator [Lachnospiraceae bacterium]MDD6551523.1 AraC family transcriptional regulator [Lachnospiraceae bacterium]
MRVSDLNIDRVYINSLSRSPSYNMAENHFHHYYECFYVRQGSCRFFVNDSLCDLEARDMLIIPPGTVHFNKYLTNSVRINIYFKDEDLHRNGEPYFPELDNRLLRLVKIHVPSAYKEITEQSIDNMLAEEKMDDENTPVMMELLLKQFLLNLSRYGIFHYDQMTEPAGTSDSDKDILKAAKYISENYNEHITLSSLAQMVGLTPSYFSRKFTQVTGTGMKEYLSYMRLDAAANQLRSTTHNITEIAMDCGFSDSNYFKDAFKKMYGVSPRTYRNERGHTDNILENSLKKHGLA